MLTRGALRVRVIVAVAVIVFVIVASRLRITASLRARAPENPDTERARSLSNIWIFPARCKVAMLHMLCCGGCRE